MRHIALNINRYIKSGCCILCSACNTIIGHNRVRKQIFLKYRIDIIRIRDYISNRFHKLSIPISAICINLTIIGGIRKYFETRIFKRNSFILINILQIIFPLPSFFILFLLINDVPHCRINPRYGGICKYPMGEIRTICRLSFCQEIQERSHVDMVRPHRSLYTIHCEQCTANQLRCLTFRNMTRVSESSIIQSTGKINIHFFTFNIQPSQFDITRSCGLRRGLGF